MRKILILLVIFSFSYASVDDLLKEASFEITEKRILKDFKIAFESYNEGLYNITEKSCLDFLKHASLNDKNRGKILELLAFTYFRTRNYWAMEHYVEKELEKGKKFLDDDTQKRVFVLLYNLFLNKPKKAKKIKEKFRYIWDIKYKKLDLPDELKDFTPYVNIFPYNDTRLIGLNKIYFSDENQTLYEVGYKTDMGYDELRESNPFLNPFDIRKGEAIFLPRKRLIPALKPKSDEIYINLTEKRLYYIYKDKYVITFPIGIGTDDTKSPVGMFKITEKRENPAWYVPDNIREENPNLPKIVPPGPDNPLGIRAMRLGYSSYLIHGTNKSFGVGLKVSHGCIRLFNRDVKRLYDLVPEGTKVYIYEKFIKASYIDNKKYIEIHAKTKNEMEKLNLNIYAKKINENYLKFVKKERRGFSYPLY